MIRPGGLLSVSDSLIIMIRPGGLLSVCDWLIIMIRPGGLLLVVPPPICSDSFSFMGRVAKEYITKLGCEKYLSTTGNALSNKFWVFIGYYTIYIYIYGHQVFFLQKSGPTSYLSILKNWYPSSPHNPQICKLKYLQPYLTQGEKDARASIKNFVFVPF